MEPARCAASVAGQEGEAARSSPEDKWAANRAKVECARMFPGRLASWAEAEGKAIDRVVASGRESVILFSDGTFVIAAPLDPEPASILAALAAARPHLESRYRQAFETLDRLIARDRELTRRSRLDKIMGALRHNVVELPELKEAVRRLLDEWNRAPGRHGKKE